MRSVLLAFVVLAAGLVGCLGGETDSTAAQPQELNESREEPERNRSQSPDGDRNRTQLEQGEANETREEDNATAEEGTGDANQTVDEDANATDEPAGPAPGTVIAEGHIQAGSPTTRFLVSITVATGQEGIDSFGFELPNGTQPGTVLATNTTDNGGLGYDLDLWFHTAEGDFLGGCSDAGDEQTCEVPEDAAQGTVDAFQGADLDVQLLVDRLPG